MIPRHISLIEVTSRSLRKKRTAPDGREWIDYSDRSLDRIKVKAILATIRGLKLPVELRSGAFGELWIHVYDSPEAPGVEPKVIAVFSQWNLGIRRRATMGNVLDDAWRLLHDKIVNTPENLQLLEYYGLEKPKEKMYYAY